MSTVHRALLQLAMIQFLSLADAIDKSHPVSNADRSEPPALAGRKLHGCHIGQECRRDISR
jgi:hypothetical protein